MNRNGKRVMGIFINLTLIFIAGQISYPDNNPSFLFIPNNANFYILGRGNSLSILNRGRLTRFKINKSLERLSSAKRIVRAGDDPAGMAVAEKMKSIIAGIKREAMNSEDLRNYLNYIESAIGNNQNILRRINQLILRASSGIMGREEKEIIQSEADQLIRQIDMNAKFSEFNRKRVIPELTAKRLGVSNINVVKNLYGSAKMVEDAMRRLRKLRSVAGTRANILRLRIKGKWVYFVNLQSAESRISDLDVSEEMTGLMKNSVLLKMNYGVIMMKR